MLSAQDLLKPTILIAKVIFDVKSTRLLAPWIKEHGGDRSDGKNRPGYFIQPPEKPAHWLPGEMKRSRFL